MFSGNAWRQVEFINLSAGLVVEAAGLRMDTHTPPLLSFSHTHATHKHTHTHTRSHTATNTDTHTHTHDMTGYQQSPMQSLCVGGAHEGLSTKRT